MAGHEDRDTVMITAPVVDLLHGPSARQHRTGRLYLVDELAGWPGRSGPGRRGEVAVPLVQPHEAIAAGVARFVVRGRDVPVE